MTFRKENEHEKLEINFNILKIFVKILKIYWKFFEKYLESF